MPARTAADAMRAATCKRLPCNALAAVADWQRLCAGASVDWLSQIDMDSDLHYFRG